MDNNRFFLHIYFIIIILLPRSIYNNITLYIIIFDKLWIVDIMFDVKYLAALHARCSIIVLVVKYVAKRDELDLS